MLDVLGAVYFVDGICQAINRRVKELNYRIYETDCLYAICKSLGVDIRRRYYDVVRNRSSDDERNGDEIVRERLERFGIKVVG